MSRLLSADFIKLRKSRFFWLSVIVMALWGIFMKVMEYTTTISYGYEPPSLSSMLFAFALLSAYWRLPRQAFSSARNTVTVPYATSWSSDIPDRRSTCPI